MKKFFASAAILYAAASLNACSKNGGNDVPDPIASFDFTTFNGNLHAPATLNFGNSSSFAADYSWNFGNGASSFSREPEYRYLTSGTYTVTLTATSSGKTHSTSRTITISPAYTKVAITGLSLSAISGQTSSFTGYFKILQGSTSIWQSATTAINPAALPVSYNIAGPMITNLSGTYFVELWKSGTFSDTRVSFSAFLPSLYNAGTGDLDSYPTSVTSTNGFGYKLQWQ